MELTQLSLKATIESLQNKEFSSVELTQAYLDRIKRYDSTLQAYITVDEAGALQAAAASDKKRSEVTDLPVLEGIPLAYKDLLSTAGVRTTCASKILDTYIPVYDATVVRKLSEAGSFSLGKTNMDEFAMGSSTENSAYYPTKNPWDVTKVPGGSSGGSAAAVAADLCSFALGTDTGGSIRQPASLTGVVGIKPTYGRVSRFGLIAMASSLDQIGTFSKTVEDSAIALEIMSGVDPYDATSVDKAADFTSHLNKDVKGLRVGVPKEFFGDGLNSEVKQLVEASITKLEDLGAVVSEVSLPHTDQSLPVYYLLMPSEVSSNLARFDGIRYGGDRSLFGSEVKRRIMLGTYALSSGYYDAYYLKASKVRTLIKKDFEHCFDSVDVVVGPVSPTVAFNIGEKTSDPLQMYLSDIYTIPANIAGLPAISMNCGFSQGLPVGFQIIGKQWDEATILNVAHVLEKDLNIKDKPKLS